MISKNKVRLIQSLKSKKNRLKEQLFLVEGKKNVAEVLSSGFCVEALFATADFLSQYAATSTKACQANSQQVSACQVSAHQVNAREVFEVDQESIRKASLLQNPQNSLAICTLPPEQEAPQYLDDNLAIYLDEIQDPGNLGTIIRLCDWFGVSQLFCSPNSADAFNPKTIQASMGSFCRVLPIVIEFDALAEIAHRSNAPIYGAYLEGENIYTQALPTKALMVMGNEGKGINASWESKIDRKICIPSFSTPTNYSHAQSGQAQCAQSSGAESLNVSMACAIICSEFKRSGGKE